MSLQTQLADAGAIKILADDLVRLLTQAIAVQAAGGVYTVPENPDVQLVLTAGQQQAFINLVGTKWTSLKTAANRN